MLFRSIAEGMKRLGWATRPKELHEQQAAAAVGQMGLVQMYETKLREHGLRSAQVLLTHADLADREREEGRAAPGVEPRERRHALDPGREQAEQTVFNERPLDQAILEYLQQEGDLDILELVVDEPLRPTFGSPFSFQVRARLCVSQAPVAGAEITLKLVSSLKKAMPLLTGRTDSEGLFAGHVELPPSQPGHCALLVGCTSDAGSDELRVLITAAKEN